METSNNPALPDLEQEAIGRARRKGRRYECDGFAEIVGDNTGFLFRGQIRDLSEDGCYIQTRAVLKQALAAQVDLHLSVTGTQITIPARIAIMRAGAGAGFEFLHSDSHTRAVIAYLLQKLAPGGPSEDPGSPA